MRTIFFKKDLLDADVQIIDERGELLPAIRQMMASRDKTIKTIRFETELWRHSWFNNILANFTDFEVHIPLNSDSNLILEKSNLVEAVKSETTIVTISFWSFKIDSKEKKPIR